jgi:group I intron endonuclease
MYINKVNGKRYIGKTIDFNRRYKEHLEDNKSLLERAINKYGIENFDIVILCKDIEDKEELNELERYYIQYYNTLTNDGYGYNLAIGGNGGDVTSQWSEQRREEFRQKMSEITKGRPSHMKGKCGELHHLYGTHRTEQTKEKIRQANTGRKHTEEELKKMSETIKGENNPMYGKPRSEETKQKIRETIIQNGSSKGSKNGSAKKITQYDLDGNLIKIWDYVKQASEELGLDHSSICKCARGKIKTCGGYKWEYITKENE